MGDTAPVILEEQALLRCCALDPADDLSRAVYADWLEEKGRDEESSLFRREWHDGRKDSLSELEQSLFVAFVHEWVAAGLAVGPCDRAPVGDLVQAAYAAASLPPPAVVIWMDSPLTGAIAANILTQAGSQVRDQVLDQVWAQVRDQVRAQVWDQVWDQVAVQVRAQVAVQVRAQVWTQVRDQVRAQVLDQVRDQVYQAAYGTHDAAWLSFCAYFASICRFKCVKPLLPLMRLSREVGWWWPFRDAVVFTERPVALEVREGKLTYVAYADGFRVAPEAAGEP